MVDGSNRRAGPVVFSSVDDVVAPPGTKPGGAFTVSIAASRKGTSVSVRRTFFASSGNMPIIHQPQRELADGSRASLRPHAVARAASGRVGAPAIDHVESRAVAVGPISTSRAMPIEVREADAGWLPGPVNGTAGRPAMAFTGRPMGVRDHTLSAKSTARQIMRKVGLSRKFCMEVIRQTRGHVEAWQAAHETPDGVERAFSIDRFTVAHVELFYAIAVRHAAINKAIPVTCLWDPKHWLYDEAVARACPLGFWQWLSRHISFGGSAAEGASDDSNEDSDEDSDEEVAQPDRHRKRRPTSDIQRELPARVFSPGQDITWDDYVRWDRHRGGKRIRYKAGGHTGFPGEALNCCRSKFFLYWEEQGWHADEGVPAAERDGGSGGGHTRADDGAGGSASCDGSNRVGGRGGTAGAAARGRGSGGRQSCQSPGGRGRGSAGGGDGSDGMADVDEPADGADEAGVAGDGQFDGAGWSPAPVAASGVNSLRARMCRALKHLQPHVGHRLWLDRGMGNLDAMAQVAADGYGVTALMSLDRVGLPRRTIAALKAQMICPRGCTHAASSNGCNRFSWAVMHKGIWELVIFSDGRNLVVTMSNCTSATRTVTVHRTSGRQNWSVQVPESLGLYTLFGRGGTDTGDQLRRMLDLSARRRPRVGPKAALFDGELCFVDGQIVANLLRSTHSTIWDFAGEFATEVLTAVTAGPASAASESAVHTRQCSVRHTPINFGYQARKQRRATGGPVSVKSGAKCCMSDMSDACMRCDHGETVKGTLFCPGCESERSGCNGWYHEACYWRRHRAVAL